MRLRLHTLYFCLALGMAGSHIAAHGEAVSCVASSGPATTDQNLPRCETLYPSDEYNNEASPWRIGLGAGYGQRSNPLINSDDIPIYGVIQLSYFGDHFFFDNGDVGWFIYEEQNWSVNAVAGVGGERSFFSFLNDSAIGFSPTDTGELGASDEDTPTENDGVVNEPEAPERDYTVDGGLELLYQPPLGELQLQLLTDLSGRHHGQEIWVSWGLPVARGRWELAPSIGFTWKSSQAANYYYGVEEDEAQAGLPAYRVGSAVNPFIRLAANYRFNEHWKLVSQFQYEYLDSEIHNSPAVDDNSISGGFVGLYYEF